MNPFSTNYHPGYFCDRQKEIDQLKSNIENGLNTLLHSPRRLGKTALILHLFHQLEESKTADTIYIDLFASTSMEDLIRLLTVKILQKYHKLNLLQGVSNVLKGLMATLSIDNNGTPQLSLNIQENQYKQSLENLFTYLEQQKKKVVIAFDEFQEVGNYREKAEAELRSHMQQLKNTKFIFSGSSSHLLQEMFQSPKRPFYQSTETVILNKIDYNQYALFIENCFKEYNKEIEHEAILEILDFTQCYTYYTQVISNHCFAQTETKLTKPDVLRIIDEHLENRKLDYYNLYSLLSANQKKMVVAIAKEELVKQPTSMEFLIKHQLPSLSSTSQALNSLLQKEIIYKSELGNFVYDIFFMRFLQKWY